MPSEQDRDAALRRIVEYTEAMGNSIEGEAEGSTDDGRPLSGYQIRHGSHTIVVATVPGWEYFTVLYQTNVAHRIALHRAVDEQAPADGENVEIELDPTAIQDATAELREHLADEDLAELRAEFVRAVAQVTPTVALDLTTEDSLVTGFQAQTKLFPYREDFDIQEFAETVQTTVTAGWIGQEYLADAYDLAELVEGDIAASSSDGEPAMFQ